MGISEERQTLNFTNSNVLGDKVRKDKFTEPNTEFSKFREGRWIISPVSSQRTNMEHIFLRVYTFRWVIRRRFSKIVA